MSTVLEWLTFGLEIASGVAVFVAAARRGQLRRIWNGPMRFSVACGLLCLLMGGAETWLGQRPGFHVLAAAFGVVGQGALALGIGGLCFFLLVFFCTALHERQQMARSPQVAGLTGELQSLILSGQTARAAQVYQRENWVSEQEAREAVEAIRQALAAGLHQLRGSNSYS